MSFYLWLAQVSFLPSDVNILPVKWGLLPEVRTRKLIERAWELFDVLSVKGAESKQHDDIPD